MRATVLGFLVAFALGCGGTPPANEPVAAAPTAGAERAVPVGPAPSFIPDGVPVIARADLARVRRSPAAADISSAIRASATWRALSGGAPVDPVQDFDAVAIGSRALYTDRRVAVLRHPHTEAEVRERILQMAVARGEAPAWREMQGLQVIPWPVQGPVPHSLVITAAHELVLAPDDELGRIATVARDHAARRTSPDELVEPRLVLRPSEVATFVSQVPMPRYEGYPDPPSRLHAEVDEDAHGGLSVAVHSEFETDAQATAGHGWLVQQRDAWAQHPLVRLSGMSRPLEAATFARDGQSVDIGVGLTIDETRRILGLMALSQMAQR